MVYIPEDIFRYIIEFLPPCVLVHKSGVHDVFRFHPSTCYIQSYDSLSCCMTHSSHDLINAVEMLTQCRENKMRYLSSKWLWSRPIHFISLEAKQIAHTKLAELVDVTASCCGGRGVMFKLRP